MSLQKANIKPVGGGFKNVKPATPAPSAAPAIEQAEAAVEAADAALKTAEGQTQNHES